MEDRHGGTRTGRPPDRLVTQMNERWKITVDRGACLGSGVCAGTAPSHFRLDDGRSRAIANTCPAEAISVHTATGHRLAPDAT